MKILYIPLDERPCNYKYPSKILGSCSNVELIIPDKAMLSSKKISANVDNLWNFVENNIVCCEYAILSIDMLIYGGLLPSRIHTLAQKIIDERVKRFKKLKLINECVKIYTFDTIMRVPSYNSSEEEPDYYNEYGEIIFRISWLKDKKQRGIATDKEIEELERLEDSIPNNYLDDYVGRRIKNKRITNLVLDLVAEGFIDFLVIPQDDSSLYGFHCLEQKECDRKITKLDIQEKVFVYPGADEVGCTLLARALNDFNNKNLSVYVRFSSTNGANIVPKYEDRSYMETIKWHITSVGGWLNDNSSEADLILMVNTPAKAMFESSSQDDLVYENNIERNLFEFCTATEQYIKKNKRVLMLDVAYSNGSDKKLINILKKMGTLSKLYGYAGWNTHANSLGTVLCSGIAGYYLGVNKEFLIYRIAEDCGYQAIVRQKIISELPSQGISYYEFKDKEGWVESLAYEYLNDFIQENLQHLFENKINLISVSFPWKRMFEADIEIVLKD